MILLKMGRSVGRLEARTDVQISRKDQYAASTLSQLGSVVIDAWFRVRIRRIEITQVLRVRVSSFPFFLFLSRHEKEAVHLQESKTENNKQGILLPFGQLERVDDG